LNLTILQIFFLGERPFPGSEEYQQFVSKRKASKQKGKKDKDSDGKDDEFDTLQPA